MLSTPFTEMFGCRVPIQLAAMPNVSGIDLAAAVAGAGGFAMLGAPLAEPDALAAMLDEAKARTDGHVGVNFLMPFLNPECLDVAAERVPLVEFFYDDPDVRLVERGRRGGARVAWQVGSVEEAKAAADAGVDVIIAQGAEAGGHVRGTTALLPLLAEVLDSVSVPVVAAGGIASARSLAAVLAAGAAAARVGTRFLVSIESLAHPRYVDALVAARAEDTVLTEAFSVMWPRAPHRVLRSAVDAAGSLASEIAGETDVGGSSIPIPRQGVIPPSRSTTGNIEAMSLYAGQSVASIHSVEPAAEIVAALVDGAERLLRARA